MKIARVQMEKLTQALMLETPNFEHLLQQLEVSFDQMVDSITPRIDQSINKNKEVIKKK
ncbi:MAG: hypothetical protein MGG11_00675 [Trichodesmium sp. MAG_R03]|nr:hypothetical protein [Trichodesmium sp. MAG_R03]